VEAIFSTEILVSLHTVSHSEKVITLIGTAVNSSKFSLKERLDLEDT
jgi:hypothetical protein